MTDLVCRRAVGLSALRSRIVLLLDLGMGTESLHIAVTALWQFVVAKAAAVAVPSNAPATTRPRPHAFAVCVLDSLTLRPRFVSKFTSDTQAVLATLTSLLSPAVGAELVVEGGDASSVAVAATAREFRLDLSLLLTTLKQHLDPNPPLSSLLHVICAYGNDSAAAPIFSAGNADAHMDVLGHPGFVFDLLYLHSEAGTTAATTPAESQQRQRQHQEKFNAFGALKVRGDYFYYKCPSFFFARSPQHEDSVHMAVAMMLQHPALRLEQPEDFAEMEQLLRLGTDCDEVETANT